MPLRVTRPLVARRDDAGPEPAMARAHGFPLPSVFVAQRSRGKIVEALELDAAGAKRLGVRVATTIPEALPLLEQLDDLENDKSVVKSIKKFFGRDPQFRVAGPRPTTTHRPFQAG